MIDIVDPVESYSAAQFCQDVTLISKQILQKGKIPLLVGGTMMYFNALQKGLSALPEADDAVRNEIEQQAKKLGWPALHAILEEVDPQSAARIHPNDAQRIGRALEIYRISGKAMSSFYLENKEKNEFSFVNLILFPEDRAWLHQRIGHRFEEMLKQGFIDEVKQLLKKWPVNPDMPALRSVGYRQVYEYLQKGDDLQGLKDKGMAATRQLAKRQLTWLRQWPDGIYFDPKETDCQLKVMAKVKEILDNNLFILS